MTTASAHDPLAALRAATAQRHQLLDTSLPLAAQDAGLDDYRRHLRMLHAWLVPFERWLAAFDDGPQDTRLLVQPDYLGLIESDLAHAAMAGAAGREMPGQDAPAQDMPWPAHAGAAYRWGACYVVEGAQLGGAVLYKRLAGRLAPHPLAYLRGAPDGPGPRWKIFIAALRAALADPAAIEQACGGAADAFDRLIALQAHARTQLTTQAQAI